MVLFHFDWKIPWYLKFFEDEQQVDRWCFGNNGIFGSALVCGCILPQTGQAWTSPNSILTMEKQKDNLKKRKCSSQPRKWTLLPTWFVQKSYPSKSAKMSYIPQKWWFDPSRIQHELHPPSGQRRVVRVQRRVLRRACDQPLQRPGTGKVAGSDGEAMWSRIGRIGKSGSSNSEGSCMDSSNFGGRHDHGIPGTMDKLDWESQQIRSTLPHTFKLVDRPF